MNDLLFKLFLEEKKTKKSAFYYRHRACLNKKCFEISLAPWMQDEDSKELIFILSKFGPLESSDLSGKLRRLYQDWKKRKLPQDPKFYRHCLKQIAMWDAFSNKTLQEFIDSSEGHKWFRKRLLLKRKAHFLLDQPFKASKAKALATELKARKLLRAQPLLRLMDLRQLGFANSQALMERFPFLEKHRLAYLQKIHARHS